MLKAMLDGSKVSERTSNDILMAVSGSKRKNNKKSFRFVLNFRTI